ncbi:hypothetical protein UA08_03080 [Talaromyces atroroseus]|uniref:Methyltransferase type 11 domain-containing protein n=1 Tax=Talaromyces atroroseus TaxID=1441469 RepID=A0A225AKQ2_TALAT|nr:hypothetical protein UA08_03080 [Talaromyces atroroseus]OKL61460.1 hypothetical protein UA08_03080 [Talaromyces atroroseus]
MNDEEDWKRGYALWDDKRLQDWYSYLPGTAHYHHGFRQVRLIEMRRLLKPGGILAVRDGTHQHFYPPSLGLDHLWVRNQGRALLKGAMCVDPTGTILPALFRRAGFDADGGKVLIGCGTTVFSGPEIRKWLAIRAASQLQPADAVYHSWLDAGITEGEIQQTLLAVNKWADTEDAWYGVLQCEMLAWK